MIVSLIVAMDENRGIGRDNQLPWHLPTDLQRFKRLTMGHHIVMGRKTYQAIGRPLPGRVMVVLTNQRKYSPKGCLVAHSIEEALQLAMAAGESECFFIGGADIFEQTIGFADKIYLTRVHTDGNSDVSFPVIDPNQWSVSSSEPAIKNERDQYTTDFKILLRNK